MKKDRYIIENIDPIKGVSTEQLLKCAEYFFSTLQFAKDLDYEKKMNIIHDSVIAVKQKMDSGLVNNYDFQEFKGYLYITIRNEYWKLAQKKIDILKQYIQIDPSIDDELFDIPDEIIEQEDDDLIFQRKSILTHFLQSLDQVEQDIIQLFLKTGNYTESGKPYGYNGHAVYGIMLRLRSAIKTYNKRILKKKYYKMNPEHYIKYQKTRNLLWKKSTK